jgi:hypothetical protein
MNFLRELQPGGRLKSFFFFSLPGAGGAPLRAEIDTRAPAMAISCSGFSIRVSLFVFCFFFCLLSFSLGLSCHVFCSSSMRIGVART